MLHNIRSITNIALYAFILVGIFLCSGIASTHALQEYDDIVANTTDAAEEYNGAGSIQWFEERQGADFDEQGYQAWAVDVYYITVAYLGELESSGEKLTSETNLTELRNRITDILPFDRDDNRYNQTAFIRGDVLIVGCGNVEFWTFDVEPVCNPVAPIFSCNNLTIAGATVENGMNIIETYKLFNEDGSPRNLIISGLEQTTPRHVCPEDEDVYVNTASLSLEHNGIVLSSSTASVSVSGGEILDETFFVTPTNIETEIKYDLVFSVTDGFGTNEIQGGECNIQVITVEDPGTCGDGVLDAGEMCEPSDSTTWNPNTHTCDVNTCQEIPFCGNGVVDINIGETCDPADQNQVGWGTGGCSNSCQPIDTPPLTKSLNILKYSNNDTGEKDTDSRINPELNQNDSFDANENDEQTILSGAASKFQIKVTNTGQATLENVIIGDDEVSDCRGVAFTTQGVAGTLIGKDFIHYDQNGVEDTDGSFDSRDFFTFNCEQLGTTEGYVNTATAIAQVVNSDDRTLLVSDDSDVFIDGPNIAINKLDDNSNDFDQEVGDDTQTIVDGDEAVFRIRVTNTGTEDLDTIVLTDSLAPNCAGIVTLPNTFPSSFSNITKGGVTTGLNDAILSPKEYFEYSCSVDSWDTDNTKNTVGVTAEQVDTDIQVDSQDDTTILDEDTVDPSDLYCGSADGETYGSSTTSFGTDIFCQNGASVVGSNPIFPGQGDSVDWQCRNGSEVVNCSADRSSGGGGGGSSGGSPAQCYDVEISGTEVTCVGNSKVGTFRVDCRADGVYQFADAQQNPLTGEYTTTFACDNGVSDPICYVHSDIGLDENDTGKAWRTSNSCQSVGTNSNPICPSDDPRCDVCEYENGVKVSGPNTCPVACDGSSSITTSDGGTITCPWGASYHNPTYATGEQNKLLCLQVTDGFGFEYPSDMIFDLNTSNRPLPEIITGLNTDQINGNGSEAVNITNASIYEGYLCMTMTSTAPGKDNFEFSYTLPTTQIARQDGDYVWKWDGNFDTPKTGTTSNPVEFRKPFTGQFNVADGTLTPKINTKQAYDVQLIRKTAEFYPVSPTYIYMNRDSVLSTTDGQIFSTFASLGDQITSDKGEFQATISAQTTDSILASPGLISNNMEIKYALNGDVVRYHLTEFDYGDDTTEFSIAGENEIDTLGLKIIGPLQGDGKSYETGQVPNFSDISKGPQRSEIKQQAYTITQGLTSGNPAVNGVYYVKGDDVILDAMPAYETLVVEDGNVIIKDNLTGNKTLGIIVIGDTTKDSDGLYNNGNIIVTPNVTEVNAIIYGDGGLVSGDTAENVFTENTAPRTQALNKQLILNGTIFTRNTIGGAVDAGSYYKLPGGEQTQNFDEASIYDLNYTRTSDGGASTYPGYHFVIRYNPDQGNLPKGFTK